MNTLSSMLNDSANSFPDQLLQDPRGKMANSQIPARIINLFIASPGDVRTERDAVEEVVNRVEKQLPSVAIKVHRWEDGPPTQGDNPQDEVERHIPDFGSLDVVVVIVWQRYGTLLKEGVSGTEREFWKAQKARVLGGRPEILFYQCTVGVDPSTVDPEQLTRLQAFLLKIRDLGVIKPYADRTQFATIFEDHLHKILNRLTAGTPPVFGKVARTAKDKKDISDLFNSIEAADERIRPHVYRTPLVRSKRLEQDLNCQRVMLKLESIQATGSFKVRGAMNAVMLRVDDANQSTFATASAGNHGLGLAYSAARWKREAFVYMPLRTPLTKRRAIERWTSHITLYGSTFEDTKDYALSESERLGYTFIHPYDDIDVIAGQGTLGLEIVRDIEDNEGGVAPDIVLVPVGGGGLIAGVATVIKHYWPKTKVIGVEAANLPSLDAAFKAGKPQRVTGGRTFADGIAVAEVGATSFDVLRHVVDDVWTVSEESMAKAVIRLVDDSRVIAEGAGSCGVGALLDKYASDAGVISNRSILIVVSGGNLDTVALTKLLQRGLVLSQRLAHLRFVAEDVPGALARLTGDLADLQVNILDLWHSRLDGFVRVGSTHVHVMIEARDGGHVESIRDALLKKGHDVSIIPE